MKQEPWEILSDQTLLERFCEVEKPIDDFLLRLVLIELLQRLKNLEKEVYAARVILEEYLEIPAELYQEVINLTSEYLLQKDQEKARDLAFYRQTGLSLAEWLRFMVFGRFTEH